ncbi:MAG TPA: hypothetical protein VHR39_14480 [Propionibacteriaceae bacterium]|jgi:hypothetical protein|nr:hypothetical protein [Propionibacteriaceae bacterium]
MVLLLRLGVVVELVFGVLIAIGLLAMLGIHFIESSAGRVANIKIRFRRGHG